MKIIFISNYFNHHQKDFCNQLYQLTNHNFAFIETMPMEQERKSLGWQYNNEDSFVYKYYIPEQKYQIKKIIKEADVIIFGQAHKSILLRCLSRKKKIFIYTERPFRQGKDVLKIIPRFLKWHLFYNNYFRPNALCAGAFTSNDYNKLGIFKNRSYKWGYYPPFRQYENINDLISAKEKNSILWVARLIELKHPELPIKVARMLKDAGYVFSLQMVGVGHMAEKLQALIDKLNLQDNVKLLGSMSPDSVRNKMEKSEVFLFTSDRNEGWGAVLNESMNSGCAVVASHAIGAVPFLIKNNKNGLIFQDQNTEDLFNKIKTLLDDSILREQIAKCAYETIAGEWNAAIAAKRFIALVKNNEIPVEGPCSIAKRITDDWFQTLEKI